MAAGVPVVVTNVGGPPEVVVDGECGFLRSPSDVDGMSEAVIRLLKDSDLARAFGEAGVKRSRELFMPTGSYPRTCAPTASPRLPRDDSSQKR